MASNTLSVESAATFLASACEPLTTWSDDASATAYAAELGFVLPSVPPGFAVVAAAASGLMSAVGDLIAADLNQTDDTAAISEVIGGVAAVVAAIQALPSSLTADPSEGGLPPDYLTASGIAGVIEKRIVDKILIDQLSMASQGVRCLLVAVGIIDAEDVSVVGGNDMTIETVRLDRLSLLFSDQRQLLSDVYGWGTPTINATQLFAAIREIGAGALSGGVVTTPPAALVTALFPGVDPTTTDVGPMLAIPLIGFSFPALTVGVMPAPQTSTSAPQGIALLVSGSPDLSISLPVGAVTVTLATDVALDAGVGILLAPGQPPQIISGLSTTPTTPGSGQLSVQLTRTAAQSPFTVASIDGGSEFRLTSYSTSLAFDLSPADLTATAGIQGGVLSLSLAGADGFLSTILPSGGLTAKFDVAIGWSKNRGVFITGSAGLTVVLSLNLEVGPVTLKSVALTIAAADQGLDLNAGLTASLTLGPVVASVQGIGVKSHLAFNSGNLGPADLSTGFLAPTGVGVSIDAGSVHGGGFITLDPTNNRYFGALQLSVYDIALSAFGLIETTLPTGPGYSFVIIISAQFTPIQLGFGFTLNGVGGMVGINRAIDTTALANLVRAGKSEDLLFPQNVVANAPAIVRDLTTVFPATQAHYVFGPLGKLGWGTPTLITGEIGVILEFPGPVVVILGEVKCLLPKPDAALVKLNLSVDGELDFPNKTFAMDAALHDSVINGFPVSGQMAMRVSWGDQPNFVFSIGGFHPAYTPPPNFPKLQPMTLDLGSHGPAKISVSGFFAVTSNTVQVGGTAKLHAGGSGITLDASVSVKALFVFQPFSFEADIDASVSVSFHGYGIGVHLSGTLDGPSPWHIKGEVCVSVLWWDACLGFDETFGGDQQVTQPSLDPWQGAGSTASSPAIIGLQQALSDPGNWSGALVPGRVSSVTRAQGADTLVDPVGGLTVRQKTAPVETANPLTKFGVARTTTPISFSNVQATLGSGPSSVALTSVQAVNEFFAPAQFFDMDDGKKLSSAAFESYQAGYLFATTTDGKTGKNAQGGSIVTFQPKMNTYLINSDGSNTLLNMTYMPTDPKVTAANQRSAVAKGGLTQAGTRRFVNRAFVESFSERLPTFVIGSSATLGLVTGAPPAAVRSATLIALDVFRAGNIELAPGVQVTALHDMPPG